MCSRKQCLISLLAYRKLTSLCPGSSGVWVRAGAALTPHCLNLPSLSLQSFAWLLGLCRVFFVCSLLGLWCFLLCSLSGCSTHTWALPRSTIYLSCLFTATRVQGLWVGAYEPSCSQSCFHQLIVEPSCFSVLVDSELGTAFVSLRTFLPSIWGSRVTLGWSSRNPSCFQSCNFSGFQAPYKVFNLLMAPFGGPGFFNNKSLLLVHEAFGGRENRHLCTDALLFWLLFLWCVISLKFSKCLLFKFLLFAELTVSEGLGVCTYPCRTRGDTKVTVRRPVGWLQVHAAASLTFLGVGWGPLFHAILPQTPSVSCGHSCSLL